MFDFLKNPILRRLLTSGVRAALVAAGGWLVAREYATEAEVTEMVAGMLPVLVSLLWSWYEGMQVNKRIETALNMPAGSSKEKLDRAMKITD
jgi:phage-related minor tail protein